MPGIISSNIGHQGGSEIVAVTYDPQHTNPQQMVSALKQQSSFHSLIVSDDEQLQQIKKTVSSSKITVSGSKPHFIESKHSLRTSRPDLYYLDLTERQAIVLNSWCYFPAGRQPDVLTDEQKKLNQRLKDKLADKKPSGLKPARWGKSREIYRNQLLNWLVN